MQRFEAGHSSSRSQSSRPTAAGQPIAGRQVAAFETGIAQHTSPFRQFAGPPQVRSAPSHVSSEATQVGRALAHWQQKGVEPPHETPAQTIGCVGGPAFERSGPASAVAERPPGVVESGILVCESPPTSRSSAPVNALHPAIAASATRLAVIASGGGGGTRAEKLPEPCRASPPRDGRSGRSIPPTRARRASAFRCRSKQTSAADAIVDRGALRSDHLRLSDERAAPRRLWEISDGGARATRPSDRTPACA